MKGGVMELDFLFRAILDELPHKWCLPPGLILFYIEDWR
jgi:hypothetical protein